MCQARLSRRERDVPSSFLDIGEVGAHTAEEKPILHHAELSVYD